LLKDAHAAIYVLTHDTASKNKEQIQAMMDKEPWLLIVDEAHNFRNSSAAGYKSLHSLCVRAQHVLLMTATPYYNGPEDVRAIIGLIQAGGFEPKLKDAVALKDNRDGYFAMFKDLVAFTPVEDETSSAFFPAVRTHRNYVVLNAVQIKKLGDLKKPLDVIDLTGENPNPFLTQSLSITSDDTSLKLKIVIADICQRLRAWKKTPDDQARTLAALVISEWTTDVLKPLYDALLLALGKDARYVGWIDGSASREARNQTVRAFNAGQLCAVCMSKAAGEGVDFLGVRQVYLLTPQWTPGAHQQFIGRAKRFQSHTNYLSEYQTVDVFEYISVPRELASQAAIETYLNWPEETRDPFEPHLTELYMLRTRMRKTDHMQKYLQQLRTQAIPLQCE
jgi:superfamily II DNA or RNA helicase